jgi:endoglucanase
MKVISRTLVLASIAVAVMVSGCKVAGQKNAGTGTDTTGVILVNQIGYYPDAQKVALIRTNAGKFEVVDAVTGKSVFKGITGEPEYWSFSGDTVRAADFSALKQPGTYRLCLGESTLCSDQFLIGDNIYTEITKASIKAFYFNRSGYEITAEYGSKWARPEGHPDTAVIVHESAASKTRPAGTVISSPGGWYDAGDYNKYIVNSSITNYTLLLFYQLYPDYCRSLNVNIPESNNAIADVVDELLYNLRWMLTMQDPADGGVYHKLTNKGFGGFEMPDKAVTPRYVVQKSTQATLDFAAVMAMASRVFAGDPDQELKDLSEICREASAKAMKWAEKNPGILYRQPDDISTGQYSDTLITDDLFWATAEMALTDDRPGDLPLSKISGIVANTPAWRENQMLGIISLVLSDREDFKDQIKAATDILIPYADELVAKSESSPYLVSLDFFAWGSNSDVANQALLKLIALKKTGDKKYIPSIQGDVDWLLGRNPTGYCFVTGFGTLSPMNIHHRPSGADGVPEPVPGFLAGGPNTSVMNDCGPLVRRSEFPAASYTDSECSYSTNEICINWNAPLFFVLAAMDEAGEREKD